MATIREQYLQSKKNLFMAEGALADISRQLEDISDYRDWSKLRKQERDLVRLEQAALVDERQLFGQAGITLPDERHFEQLRASWATCISPEAAEFGKINEIEGRLIALGRQKRAIQWQMRKINQNSFRPILNDQVKARVAKAKCDSEFKRLRDLVWREQNFRQAAKSQLEQEAKETVRIVTAVLDHPSEPLRARVRQAAGGKKRKKTAQAERRGNRGEEMKNLLKQVDQTEE